MDRYVFKILSAEAWRAAQAAGVFEGAGIDLSDGYIHLSSAAQAAETARLHFRDTPGLVLLTVDTRGLGSALRWEPSRGGDLFPHLYAPLPAAAVTRCTPLPLGADGVPRMPPGIGGAGA